MSVAEVAGTAADVLGLALLVAGVVLVLVAALGVLRLPDVLSRLHAASKPQVLGLLLVMVALALLLRRPEAVGMLLLAGLLQLVTAPVSAHMVGRAAYRTGKVRHDLLVVDELGHLSGREAPDGGMPEGCEVVDDEDDEDDDESGTDDGDHGGGVRDGADDRDVSARPPTGRAPR